MAHPRSRRHQQDPINVYDPHVGTGGLSRPQVSDSPAPAIAGRRFVAYSLKGSHPAEHS